MKRRNLSCRRFKTATAFSFFEKIKIKGLQIIENGVKIEVNGQVCTAKGSLLVEEEAVRTQKPVIEIQEENDQHLEEEREQT